VGPYRVDWGVALHKREEVCTAEPCRLKKCPKNLCMEAIKVPEVIKLIQEWWEVRYLRENSIKKINGGRDDR
jgi:hypothetical protein